MKRISLLERINIFRSSDFRDKINEVIAAVNWLLGRNRVGGGPGHTGHITRTLIGIPVELTATNGDEEWEFKEKLWDSGTTAWVDVSGGLTHTELGEIRPMGTTDDDVPYAGTVGDIVYIYPKVINDGSTTTYEFVPRQKKIFTAKVTASSSASLDHTIVEIDGEGNTITGGLTVTDAQFLNGRKGVPVNTQVLAIVEDPASAGADPLIWLVVGEGQQGTTKDLTPTGHSADSTDWDVENQGGTLGVFYDTSRSWITTGTFSFFSREITTDASGDSLTVGSETRRQLLTSSEDAPIDAHICGVNTGNTALTLKINQPQASLHDLVLQSTDGSVTFDVNGGGAASTATTEFDNSGRCRIARGAADHVIDLAVDVDSVLPDCSGAGDRMLIWNDTTNVWECIETVDCPTS